ncbi:thiazolylpeptide-type bacteriocin [Streptomyces sp. NPDC048337]|uniref:thiazolylpeptide-type bacteriocin n=1 Tax=Streptomyces sp. NPDC048337 TaxID=3365535 RepID=UPI00371EC4BA
MAFTDIGLGFDIQDLDLGDLTVTAMRDTAGLGGTESHYPTSSSCNACSGCSVIPQHLPQAV